MIKDPSMRYIMNLMYSYINENCPQTLLRGYLYPTHSSVGFRELMVTGEKKLIDLPLKPYMKLTKTMEDLQKENPIASTRWNHFSITLDNNGKCIMRFAYIPEEDHFHGLCMKSVSELTEEEAKANYIPTEIWKERVRLKKNTPQPPQPEIPPIEIQFDPAEFTVIPHEAPPKTIDLDPEAEEHFGLIAAMKLLLPADAEAIEFEYEIYPNSAFGKLYYVDDAGERHNIAPSGVFNGYNASQATDYLMNAMHPLHQEREAYGDWNQATVFLNRQGGSGLRIEDIGPEDWSGIHLKRIGQLSEAEWQTTDIPRAVWEERVRLQKEWEAEEEARWQNPDKADGEK